MMTIFNIKLSNIKGTKTIIHYNIS